MFITSCNSAPVSVVRGWSWIQVGITRIAEKGMQGGVLVKLFIFSISLAVVPISSYFLSEKYLWDGNSTFAALTAAFSANLVLAGYILISMQEENRAIATAVVTDTTESKKDR